MINQVPGVYQEWLVCGDPPQPCLNFEAVIVTAYWPYHREKNHGKTEVIGAAWRKGSDSEWTIAQREQVPAGIFDVKCLRPHPDADRVWADYCAAMLTR